MNQPLPAPKGFRLAQKLLRVLLRLLTRLDVEGLEHLPARGPAILTTNHVVWTDVAFVAAFAKAAPVTLAAEKWEGVPLIGWLLAHFGQAIFVHRGEPDRHALMAVLKALQEGNVLGIAPEGTRSYTGILQEGKDGTAWLASRTGALLVPVVVWGHEHMFSDLLHLRRAHVHFRVGRPYRLPEEARRARSRDLKQYTEMIMRRMAELLPPERRGIYA
ncbi:MAG: 1-acyl-sn-glycerol-3-phosphate acyltransferase [Caldilineae bacterium]|nr:MAG: 1-acyl-sn-glycerol-3-phosphate acyltransferase [Caldilineae bacterium]